MEQKNNFLDQVAAHLLATHRQRFRDLVVVVPGRRSGAHLKLKLARMADTPVWMPRIVSIGDLHTFLSGKKTAIRPHLLLGLYECHVNAHGQLADGFEAFLNYAPTVLADFSEADSYLVNTRKLYGDLRSIKEIEAWSLNDPQLTPEQESYVRFWRRMGELNDTFDQWQEQTGNLTRGKLAKTTALQIETLVSRWHNQYFVYAGTHALHAADQHILNFLVERGMAEVLRDTDEYYLSIDQHEAAYHLRKEPDNGLWKGDYYREIPKTITIHRCGTGITTSAVAAQLLQTSDEGTRAVVLTGDPDFDVLRHAIPPDGPSLRYSGTTRLGETPVFTWLLLWCRLMQENPAGKLRIHHKTFIDWLSEETCTGINRALSGDVSRYIIRQNLAWIDNATLETLCRTFPQLSATISLLTAKSNDIESILSNVQQWAGAADQERLPEGFDRLLAQTVSVLREYHSKHPGWLTPAALPLLLRLSLSGETVPVSRQDAADIEVMGMLETRALDFDHVIILGTTEGQLPTPWNANSFIPWEVRSLYHLPGREHHEALFAYHFYRLLQRARKVDLIYQLNGEGLGTPSPSRYLLQLESELPRWHPATRISKKDWLNHPSDRSAIPWVIPGMATINERIRTHLAAGLSPSALNTWINCPLDFYFQYVARLGEPEEVEETTGSATMGTIIHHVLEHFYIRHVGGFPSVSEIETFQHQLDGAISTAFHEARIRHHSDGINYLVSRVVREMLLTFLEREKQVVTDAPVLMALEEELTYDLPAQLTGGLPIRLKGKADRIERLGNVITIIDYKSGKVESKDITFSTKKGIERLFTQPELSKLRQILMYQLMYMRKHKVNAEQCRGVFISFVRQESGRQSALINGNHPDDDFMDTFESALVTHLLNLINSTEWQHNTESKYCAYCGVISEANPAY